MSALESVLGAVASLKAIVARVRGRIGGLVGEHDPQCATEVSTVWLTVLCAGSWICLSGVNGPHSLRWAIVFLACAVLAALGQVRAGTVGSCQPERLALVL